MKTIIFQWSRYFICKICDTSLIYCLKPWWKLSDFLVMHKLTEREFKKCKFMKDSLMCDWNNENICDLTRISINIDYKECYSLYKEENKKIMNFNPSIHQKSRNCLHMFPKFNTNTKFSQIFEGSLQINYNIHKTSFNIMTQLSYFCKILDVSCQASLQNQYIYNTWINHMLH